MPQEIWIPIPDRNGIPYTDIEGWKEWESKPFDPSVVPYIEMRRIFRFVSEPSISSQMEIRYWFSPQQFDAQQTLTCSIPGGQKSNIMPFGEEPPVPTDWKLDTLLDDIKHVAIKGIIFLKKEVEKHIETFETNVKFEELVKEIY